MGPRFKEFLSNRMKFGSLPSVYFFVNDEAKMLCKVAVSSNGIPDLCPIGDKKVNLFIEELIPFERNQRPTRGRDLKATKSRYK